MEMSAELLLEELKNNAELRGIYSAVLKSDFKSYTLTLFYLVNGSKYKLKPFHLKVMKALQDLVEGKNTKRNLALCLPVGAGKSILVEYFITWCFARSVDNTFVYTAYSDRLINKLSKETKDIIEHPSWKILFNHYLKKDDRQKINYSFQGAKNRTGLTAGTMSSALTGLDAGHPSVEGFSGALICFPYEQRVWTDKGKLQIGDIVENKLDVKVFSMSADDKVQLKPIEAYVKHEGDELIKVTLKDGNSFTCTQSHRVWTENRGYVEAKDLIGNVDTVLSLSNLFDLVDCKASLFDNMLSRIILISNKFKKLAIQSYLFAWFVFNFARKTLKRMTSLNSLHSSNTTTEVGSDFSVSSFVTSYLDYIFPCEFASREYKRTQGNRISHIFRFCAIAKVFKTIIKGIRIKMANLDTFFLVSDKRPHNKLMDLIMFRSAFLRKSHSIISLCIDLVLKHYFWHKIPTSDNSLVGNPMSKAFNKSSIGNLIKPLVIRDVLVDNISFCGHSHSSFCLTVQDNHNMFVGESKGFLVKNCDDPSSADEITYPNARETVIRTYDDKLATRRRTATTPTILIMQRLHVDDLVGWTKKMEPDEWEYVEIPALDEENHSFWEERYPAKDLLKMRDQNPYKFQAQYQQNPIIAGGQIIKSEWFQFYQSHPHYTKLFIASDTAMKTGQHNDYSVMMVWGVYEHSIYLIDMVRGKWEAPDLLRQVRMLTNQYYLWENRLKMSAFYVEDKASGTGLIQQMKRESRVPIIPIQVTKDKVTRVEEVLPTLQAGRVFLPFGREYGQNPTIIGECETFARDLSHAHDDICLVAGTKVATLFGDKNIEEMKMGDLVITPFGIKKVLDAGQTGFTETIQNLGLEGTCNHKVFAGDKFENLCDLKYDGVVDTLSYGGLFRWKYKKLLNLMESNTDLWERKDIILANQTPMLAEKVLKDFMLRFGNIIADKKYRKAMLFTTKMATILTTTSLTWSVYQLANISKNIKQSLWNIVGQKNNENIWKKLESLLKNGTQAKKVENGIVKMLKELWIRKEKQKHAQTAEGNIKPVVMPQYVNVVCEQSMPEITDCVKKKVYNIKVQDIGVYYANGILVSNCDTLVHSINVSVGMGRTFSIFET